MKKQSYNTLCYYLKKSDIFFNRTTLKQLITSHPDADFLYAMIDALNEINIKIIALKQKLKWFKSNDFQTISSIITKEERKFIVVEDISENQVHIIMTPVLTIPVNR